MAVLCRVAGVALTAGTSKNRRVYTPTHIREAVRRARARLAGEGEPLVMLTHHQAEDDSTRIVGRLTGLRASDDGTRLEYTAEIADTEHGRTIAALLEAGALETVSVRGQWIGDAREVLAEDGEPAETAPGFELLGLDMTRQPGVAGTSVRIAESHQGDERVFAESVDAAVVVPVDVSPAVALAKLSHDAFRAHSRELWTAVYAEQDRARAETSSPFWRTR